jgi:suppressor for copper-sensitivity B
LINILYQQGGMRSALSLFALLILLKLVLENNTSFLNNTIVRIAMIIALSSLCIYCPAKLARQELLYNSYKDSLWQNFTRQTLEEALAQKQTVLVDVTANWCGTCQYNKMLVLERSWTVNMLVDKKVINLRASLDRENPEAQLLMAAKKVYAIPLTIVYGPKAPNGIILPTVYSYKILKQAINDAAGY